MSFRGPISPGGSSPGKHNNFGQKMTNFIMKSFRQDSKRRNSWIETSMLNEEIALTDSIIACEEKHFSVATTNGIRNSNEDRYRVITDLELYAKAILSDKSLHSFQEAIDKKALEQFPAEIAPKLDLKKILKQMQKRHTRTEFYGVFDGHGGAQISSILALLFPLYLLRNPEFHVNLDAAIKHACQSMNDEILKRTANAQCNGGSTAVSCLIRDNVAYISNTGDSRAILISKEGVTPLTTDHKATNEAEKKRIEEAGGTIVYVKGIARVNGRLAVARAFGDAELQQFVIATPDIIRKTIALTDEYIVMASDGLWDMLSNEQVLSCIRNNPWLETEQLARVLLDRALELGSVDNITVLVVDIRHRVIGTAKS